MPVIEFTPICRDCKFVSREMAAGISPTNLLFSKFILVSDPKEPILVGIVPFINVTERSSDCKVLKDPIEVGILPLIEVLAKPNPII